MAIFNRLTKAQIEQDFDYYGLMFGIVPVYIGAPYSMAPRIAVRNGWPEWLLGAVEALVSFCDWFASLYSPDLEPTFWFKLTRKIKKG